MNPAEMQRHQATWALLPWLANGSATPAQRRQAEAHLASCADCREALRREQQLAAGMAEATTPGPDLESGLAKLMGRLDAADLAPSSPRPTAPARRGRGWAGWAALTAGGVRVPVAALAGIGALQLLLVSAIAAWWWAGTPTPSTSPDYRTLTDPPPVSSGAPRGVLRVVFQGERRMDEVQGLLLQRGLVVLAGPSEAGVFTLGWSDAAGPRDADQLAAELRHQPAVVFAESTGPAR